MYVAEQKYAHETRGMGIIKGAGLRRQASGFRSQVLGFGLLRSMLAASR